MPELRSRAVQPVMPRQTASGGLQRKLLRSHLSVVALGVGMLGISLASIVWLRSNIRSMETHRWPTVQATTSGPIGVQRSLASLRGWIASV